MLVGEAKKAYQKEYMREWQRKRRSKQGLNNNDVRSKQIEARSKQISDRSKQGLIELDKAVSFVASTKKPLQEKKFIGMLTKEQQTSKRGFNA